MKKMTMVVMGIFFLMLIMIPAADAQQTQLGEQDQEFLEKAAKGNLLEIQLGELAIKRAGADEVVLFGNRMVRDHSDSLAELEKIAQQKGVTLPTELDEEQKGMVERFSQLSGEDFDREYMQEMVKEHEEDIELYKTQAAEGQDPELREYAARAVQILITHREIAQGIQP
jgi:putative membrane protein